MSVRRTKSSSVSPVTRPQLMPATGFLIGTPAAIRAMQDAQVEAMEVDPLDSFVQTIHNRVLLYQGDKEVAFNMTLEEEYLKEITKAKRKGHEDGLKAGLEEGREKGLAEGREKGAADMQERLNQLNLRLMELGRLEELQKSFTDAVLQRQLLEEFEI